VPTTKARRRPRQAGQAGPQGMTARKAAPPKPPPDGWSVSYEIKVNGRHVTPGTELSIDGGDGRYLFTKYVETAAGRRWIDAKDSEGRFVSFKVDRVGTVHRINRTRANGKAAAK
jgi:hypothetical protein